MRISLAFICDAANVSEGNKVNVLGIFSTIASKRFPVTFPSLSLVVKIDADSDEAGDHSLAVKLIDGDGNDVLPPVDVPIELKADEEAVLSVTTLSMVTFPGPSDYRFEISVDTRPLISLPLKVVNESP